jgi:hypothetical protein
MEMLIKILGLAILGFMIAEWFQPIQWVKNKFKLFNIPVIGKHFYCVKCTSFWLALIVTGNLYIAGIVSILGYTISFLVYKIEEYYAV